MRPFILALLFSISCIVVTAQPPNKDSLYLREHYEKFEYMIPMRDGVKLFTSGLYAKRQIKGLAYPDEQDLL